MKFKGIFIWNNNNLKTGNNTRRNSLNFKIILEHRPETRKIVNKFIDKRINSAIVSKENANGSHKACFERS